jgi:two-component system chemotaxis sensor kinase CheA
VGVDDDLLQRLRVIFVEELEEHVGVLNRELLLLEGGPKHPASNERIRTLFRAAHTLKGASRSVNLEPLAKLCHAMEDLLADLRDGRKEVTPEVVSSLFVCADALAQAGAAMRSGAKVSAEPFDKALSALRNPTLGAATAPAVEQAKAPAAAIDNEADLLLRGLLNGLKNLPTDPAERLQRFDELAQTAAKLHPPFVAATNDSVVLETLQAIEMILAGGAMEQLALTPEVLELLTGVVEAVQDVWNGILQGIPQAGGPLETLQPLLTSLLPTIPTLTPEPVKAPPAPTPVAWSVTASAPPPDREGLAASAIQASRMVLGKISVRVPVEKLDDLLAQSGEMLLAERRLAGCISDVQQLRDQVRSCRREWIALDLAVQKQLYFAIHENGENGPSRGLNLPQRSAGRLAEQMQERGRRLTQLERELDRISRSLARDGQEIRRAWEGLNENVHRVRMLPFSEACRGFDRLLRDLAHSLGKQIDLTIEGGQTQLDSAILERLRGPLVHLLQNAASHGAESQEERVRAGKPPLARVRVSAAVQGGLVEVTVADDGRGLDLEALAARLLMQGRLVPEDRAELIQTIFQPGVSTSTEVSDVSGRGVGLDVVKAEVEQMHGDVHVSFVPGSGTQFCMRLPLTLTTLRVLLVTAGNETLAFASSAIERLYLAPAEDVRQVNGRTMLALPGRPPAPLVRLTDVLGMSTSRRPAADARQPIVLVQHGQERVAFAVEAFLTEQDFVVKSLGARLLRVRHLAGASVLPSGRIALLLNTAEVLETALRDGRGADAVDDDLTSAAPTARKRLIVAEDSFTTRTLLKHRLEAAGYEVAAARHGAEAWSLLQDSGADLLLSDVDMPELDGFRLAQLVRRSPQYRYLPIVLMTSRATAADREAGAEAGANAYLIKSAFDQRALLETIAQLV